MGTTTISRGFATLGLLVAASALAASCTVEDDPPATFIAFGKDFAGYHSWTSFEPTISLPGNEHLNGPRMVYVNHLPEPGSGKFPVGTIFVKESGDGDPSTREVFASVKRGGDFNAAGAVGWEWFQLANGAGDRPTIQSRGFGPPGDAYGGDSTGGCNTCHAAAQWDYVWTATEFHLL